MTPGHGLRTQYRDERRPWRNLVYSAKLTTVTAPAYSETKIPLVDRVLPVSRHTLRIHKISHRLYETGHRSLAIVICEAWKVVTGIEVRPPAMIGNHVQFVHGQGIVIGATAVIGDGTRILQQVSVGNNGITEEMPTIGEQVSLMAGAKVIGPITVGDRAVVGANAVVTHEVPPGAIVAGSPARVIGWVDGFGPDTERGPGTDTET